MLPVQSQFPNFVNNQLLTATDLNELFGYLDEQGRLTRTNLIGIGIVCGLNLKVNATGTQVTIGKGCGVTSEGYLITVETLDYTQYRAYDVNTEIVYKNFQLPGGGEGPVNLEVWELLQQATEDDSFPLDSTFLNDKVILLFVELKWVKNKNCDPQSCDDKGEHITVSFLPMAVSKEDAENYLLGSTVGAFGKSTYTALAELRMKRWDVDNTRPNNTKAILEGYLNILNKPFIDSTGLAFQELYNKFKPFFEADFQVSPFANFSNTYSFLYDGSMGNNQLLHLQYFYDLFSDMLLTYQELREAGTRIMSACCPDQTLFPRHLLLGEAYPSVTEGQLPLRHYFIFSPLFDKQNTVAEIKMLFRKLALLTDCFHLPAVQGNNLKEDPNIRITPSMLWDIPLSEKAIPYYYHVNTGARPLYLHWNYRRTQLADAENILSYHASKYHGGHPGDFVNSPLQYDLEPYNFLRVEGIVGKNYVNVLTQVKRQIRKSRLPIDIIALSTDDAIKWSDSRLLNAANSKEAGDMICHFQDLESMYDSMRRELLCTLCKELRYYYDFTIGGLSSFTKNIKTEGSISEVGLFDVCQKGYVIKKQSFGAIIEHLHRQGLTDETLTLVNFYEAFGLSVDDKDNDGLPDGIREQMAAFLLVALNLFKIPLGIVRLSTLLADDLSDFDAKAFCSAADAVAGYAQTIKSLFGIFTGSPSAQTFATETEVDEKKEEGVGAAVNPAVGETNRAFVAENQKLATGTTSTGRVIQAVSTSNNGIFKILVLLLMVEDFLDHLDVLIYNCKCSAFLSLKRDYLVRYQQVARLRQFGYFTGMHPGIQHKAGVPMGGTFIIVYHSERQSRVIEAAMDVASGTRRINVLKKGLEEEILGDTIRDDKGVKQRNIPTLIAGRIEDEKGEPLAGAKLKIEETGQGAISNADGFFKITSKVVPFTVMVQYPGYEDFVLLQKGPDDGLLVVMQERRERDQDVFINGVVFADFYLPYRCCSDCPPVQFIINEKEPPVQANIGPNAVAGQDQDIELPLNKVTLNGSASTDPDGTIVQFQWAKLSGPGSPSIITPNSAVTDVVGLEEGVYEFELSVTDDKGAIARDSLLVKILPPPPPPNTPPVADAGGNRTLTMGPNQMVTTLLDGTKSKDKEGAIVAYDWQQSTGTTMKIDFPQAPVTMASFFAPGEYKVALTVTDAGGLTGTDKITITVLEPENKPPVADAGEDQVIVLSGNTANATLVGSKSFDPEGAALSYKWALQSPTTSVAIKNPDSPVTTVSGLTVGAFTFDLTVTDDKNATGKASVTITVTRPENKPPVANAGNDFEVIISPTNNGAALNGSLSFDPEGLPLKYFWETLAGPNAPFIEKPVEPVTMVRGLIPGTYVFKITVTDAEGATDEAKVTGMVRARENTPPTADAGKDREINLSATNAAIILDGSNSSDPEGTPLKYLWKTETGPNKPKLANPEGVQTLVTGLVAGEYKFSLTVTDVEGAKSTATVLIIVKAPDNKAPVANAGPDQFTQSGIILLDGSQSKDPEGKPLKYQWKLISNQVGVAIAKPNEPKTQVTGLFRGAYIFELTVSDPEGLTSTDTVQITPLIIG